MDWVEWFIGENSVVDLVFVFTTERGLLEKHLVNEYTKCPPVDSAAVLLIQQNLSNVSERLSLL